MEVGDVSKVYLDCRLHEALVDDSGTAQSEDRVAVLEIQGARQNSWRCWVWSPERQAGRLGTCRECKHPLAHYFESCHFGAHSGKLLSRKLATTIKARSHSVQPSMILHQASDSRI